MKIFAKANFNLPAFVSTIIDYIESSETIDTKACQLIAFYQGDIIICEEDRNDRANEQIVKEILEEGKTLYFPFTLARLMPDVDEIECVDGNSYVDPMRNGLFNEDEDSVEEELENILGEFDTLGYKVYADNDNLIFEYSNFDCMCGATICKVHNIGVFREPVNDFLHRFKI